MRLFVMMLAVFLSGCAANQSKQEADRLLSMTKEMFYTRTTVQDDALDTRAEINTQNGFQQKHGLIGVVLDDNFLRAYIDKETGLTVYQVYDRMYMKDWGYYYKVNYSTPSGVKSVKAARVASDVESCSSNAFIGCKLREDVAWHIDRELLDTIAGMYRPGQREVWKYKVIGQQGPDRERGFTAAEVAAFVEKVDDYKKRHKLP